MSAQGLQSYSSFSNPFIQRLYQTAFPSRRLVCVRKKRQRSVRRKHIFLKKAGIFHIIIIKFRCHKLSPFKNKRNKCLRSSRLFLLHVTKFMIEQNSIGYFTAPVIPSANAFCRQKNTIAVGRVQIKTANISIP